MHNNMDPRFRSALTRIAELAATTLADIDRAGQPNTSATEPAGSSFDPGCVLKHLPPEKRIAAAAAAVRINPANAPAIGPIAQLAPGIGVARPQFIAMLTSKYWGPNPRSLTVSFLESSPTDLRARILSHMNSWTRTACISFVETSGVGEVRISRGPGGYWSYLGTDILSVDRNEPTMNLEQFTMNTPESEYRRVVRHETGHTLGFPHEHMRQALVRRIDPTKAYAWFLQQYGWDRATVDEQVLTPLDEAQLTATSADQDSIMCYQLPGDITFDGQPIRGGLDIDVTDYQFAGTVYPKRGGQLSTFSEQSDVTAYLQTTK